LVSIVIDDGMDEVSVSRGSAIGVANFSFLSVQETNPVALGEYCCVHRM